MVSDPIANAHEQRAYPEEHAADGEGEEFGAHDFDSHFAGVNGRYASRVPRRFERAFPREICQIVLPSTVMRVPSCTAARSMTRAPARSSAEQPRATNLQSFSVGVGRLLP